MANKTWLRLVLSGFLYLLICDIAGVNGAAFKSPNKDGEYFFIIQK